MPRGVDFQLGVSRLHRVPQSSFRDLLWTGASAQARRLAKERHCHRLLRTMQEIPGGRVCAPSELCGGRNSVLWILLQLENNGQLSAFRKSRERR